MPSESEFLNWLSSNQRARDSVRVGIGDDLAVLNWNGAANGAGAGGASDLLLVGIDQVLDGVHFDSAVHPPRAIGRKAMNRNLSDCAAMACLPAGAVVSVALPRASAIEFAQELYLGLKDAADLFDCPIVGGDTSGWDGKLAMSVAILGKSAGISPITRSGARVGDGIYVTGALGGSILGRHLSFTPRIALARELAALGIVTSMIDISDGLSRDLNQICVASNIAAEIVAEQIPVHEDVEKLDPQLSSANRRSSLLHALNDGEDHELLFTASKNPNHPSCVRIGTIIDATPGDSNRVWTEIDGESRALPRARLGGEVVTRGRSITFDFELSSQESPRTRDNDRARRAGRSCSEGSGRCDSSDDDGSSEAIEAREELRRRR